MIAANMPGGEFTLKGCMKNDKIMLRLSEKNAKAKGRERRRKISEAKLAANQGKDEL